MDKALPQSTQICHCKVARISCPVDLESFTSSKICYLSPLPTHTPVLPVTNMPKIESRHLGISVCKV